MMRFVYSAVLATLLAAPTLAAGDTPSPSTEPIHVRVLFENKPSRQAVVSWTTNAEGQKHRLYVDTQSRDGELSAYAKELPSIHSAPYTIRRGEDIVHSWGHNVLLDNLEPATAYYLVVASGDNVSREYHFITAPEDDREIRLVAVGDSRVGSSRTKDDNNRRKVNAVMRELFEKHDDIVAMLHGADYTNRAHWNELYYWLKDHSEVTTTEAGRLLPIIPARGNHDTDIGFEEIFWWPERATSYYYTTHLSGDVAVITLNTEISLGGDQREWLEQQLKTLRPANRWLIAQYHRPSYPSVRSYNDGEGRRRAWVPLFEKHNLDLAYEGHDHALKRTVPIRDGKHDPERGITYIGDGGGGVSPRKPDPTRWYLQSPGLAISAHHTHLFTFKKDELHIQAIGLDREVLDEFTLTRDNRRD